jgi:nitroreductase
MNSISVSEAVDRRMSVRGFLPKPVPCETVREILDKARRAPSGGNVQPWKVDVIAGEALSKFNAVIAEKLQTMEAEPAQYEVYPPKLWEPHRSYRYKTGEDLYALINIPREDKMGRLRQLAENFRFFGAPVGLFFSLHKKFGPPQWSDIGMYMQTVMLLATERGLDTCAQEAWSRYPETIKSFCGLDDDAVVFSGMAMGYRDPHHPLNRLRTDRASLDVIATFHGFED